MWGTREPLSECILCNLTQPLAAANSAVHSVYLPTSKSAPEYPEQQKEFLLSLKPEPSLFRSQRMKLGCGHSQAGDEVIQRFLAV